MTLVLHLVRHASYPLAGRVLAGRSEHGLDEAGHAQARALAERLAGTAMTAVYTSPRRRAVETARALAQPHGLEPVVDAGLDEMDFGAWSGREIHGFGDDPLWRGFNTVRSLTRPPGGETMLEAQVRIAAFAERASTSHPDSMVAAVGHADPIRALLCLLLAMPLDLMGRIELQPGAVATVAVDPWGARLLSLAQPR